VTVVITVEQLQQHADWLRGGSGKRIEVVGVNLRNANLRNANLSYADLRRANLRGASLRGADLSSASLYGANFSCADLCGANLSNVIGNMREIKSAQFDRWAVAWSADVLAIGCQQHAIEKWRNADPRWIAAMDLDATDWWSRYGALVLQLIDASPATGKLLEVVA
jgi:hypothetical protein